MAAIVMPETDPVEVKVTDSHNFESVLGEWTGTNKLWLPPENEEFVSQSSARFVSYAQGQFYALSYTWSFEGKPEDGLIVFPAKIEGPPKSVWIDSWHMSNDIMICETQLSEKACILKGSYAVSASPDWGWRIEIKSSKSTSISIHMFNVTPDGEEALAVAAEYSPIKADS